MVLQYFLLEMLIYGNVCTYIRKAPKKQIFLGFLGLLLDFKFQIKWLELLRQTMPYQQKSEFFSVLSRYHFILRVVGTTQFQPRRHTKNSERLLGHFFSSLWRRKDGKTPVSSPYNQLLTEVVGRIDVWSCCSHFAIMR